MINFVLQITRYLESTLVCKRNMDVVVEGAVQGHDRAEHYERRTHVALLVLCQS